MRKGLALLLAVLMGIGICACRQHPAQAGADRRSAPDVSVETAAPEPADGTEADVDLTALNATMAYSQVCDMILSPGEYVGKTVKMSGRLIFYEQPQTGARHFACVIADAAACCARGLEFLPSDADFDPERHQGADANITVMGIFETYEENGVYICRLTGARLEDPC